MKSIVENIRQGLIEVDNAIYSEFNKQVDSLGSWDLLCHNVSLLESALKKKDSERGVCDCPQGSICEFFDIKTENCMYGKEK